MLAVVHNSSGPLSYRYLVETAVAIEYPLGFFGNQVIKCSLYK